MMMYVWLIIGFILLIKGADYFVDGSSSVAKLLRVPTLVIGLTVVAFGTSAPELAVSATAAINGNNGIALGNVIGSNMFNLLVVVGICGIIMPMTIDKSILTGDFLLSIGAAVILLVMVWFDRMVGRIDGIILLILFLLFLIKTVKGALNDRKQAAEMELVYEKLEVSDEIKTLSPLQSMIYVILGLAAIVIGGDLTVDSASEIAKTFGLTEEMIGLTIVAMGTSLPELVTSIVASGKGENGLALGNVIGSNLFNILMVLALSVVIHPILVDVTTLVDLAFLIISSAITWFMAKSRCEINRIEGTVMVLLYAGYMIYIIMR